MSHPGSPTAFEDLVDHYDAARPTYPDALYDGLAALSGRPDLSGARLLELGAGTGLATTGLLARGADVTATDLGPRMLGRLHAKHPSVPVVVAPAEALPFAAASFDLVAGAQMWHWVDVRPAAAEAARVLRPGGRLCLWWNEVDADGLPWWDAQQDRLEAGNPAYRRGYRDRDHGVELTATGSFTDVQRWEGSWQRTLDWPLYERWLRSKSYVQALGDPEAFVAAERASLLRAFPDGRIVEPFRVVLWSAAPTLGPPGRTDA